MHPGRQGSPAGTHHRALRGGIEWPPRADDPHGLNPGNMDDAPVDRVGQLLWPHSVVVEFVGRRGRLVHRNWGAARGLRHGRSSRATLDEFKKTAADTSGKTVKDHMSLRVDTSLPTSSFNMEEPTLLGRMWQHEQSIGSACDGR